MLMAAAGGLNLNVVATGTGELALVFLHYWGGSSKTWLGVTGVLQDRYRCIAYDQRGWGASDAPASGYALEDLAADAFALIAALKLEHYVLVGHSMGGKAAQLLASQRPEGLQALILVAPASPSPQHIPEEALETQKHAYDNRENALGAIDFLTVRRPNEKTVEQLLQDSLGGSQGAKRAWPDSVAYQDISEEVTKIAVPTLILVGDHDRQDPEEQQRGEVLPLIAGAKLVVVTDCGHLIPIDQPNRLAEEITKFLTEQVSHMLDAG